jgi:predicted lysophospholipase L1 biosynthesis ABC-type transport system permease subunit
MSPEEARYAALRKLGNELKRVRGMRVTPGYFQGRAYSTGRRPLLHQKGAQRLEVVWMVLGQGLRTTLIGIAIGVPAALTFARLLTGLLFEVEPTDLMTFVSVPMLLVVTSLLAAVIPSLKAAGVDPIVALRHE